MERVIRTVAIIGRTIETCVQGEAIVIEKIRSEYRVLRLLEPVKRHIRRNVSKACHARKARRSYRQHDYLLVKKRRRRISDRQNHANIDAVDTENRTASRGRDANIPRPSSHSADSLKSAAIRVYASQKSLRGTTRHGQVLYQGEIWSCNNRNRRRIYPPLLKGRVDAVVPESRITRCEVQRWSSRCTGIVLHGRPASAIRQACVNAGISSIRRRVPVYLCP